MLAIARLAEYPPLSRKTCASEGKRSETNQAFRFGRRFCKLQKDKPMASMPESCINRT
jgi:hypothetical protein